MGKVPEYNLRAINNYNAKFDRVAVNLPKGSKERIKELTGKSCNAYISALVLADLDRLEAQTKKQPTCCEKAENKPVESEEKRRAREAYENFRMYPKDYTQEEIDNMTPEEIARLKRLTEMKIMLQDMEARYGAKKEADQEEGTR